MFALLGFAARSTVQAGWTASPRPVNGDLGASSSTRSTTKQTNKQRDAPATLTLQAVLFKEQIHGQRQHITRTNRRVTAADLQ